MSLQAMRLTDSLAESIGQRTGLLIVATEAGGPADTAGLYQGDIVIALDGLRTRSLDEPDGASEQRPDRQISRAARDPRWTGARNSRNHCGTRVTHHAAVTASI
ncbi:MAG: PDZ domain-containing protein [Chloroflexi bacterium]|nr:PDZ domain-containing protein [Chloroflexota bacterium]